MEWTEIRVRVRGRKVWHAVVLHPSPWSTGTKVRRFACASTWEVWESDEVVSDGRPVTCRNCLRTMAAHSGESGGE